MVASRGAAHPERLEAARHEHVLVARVVGVQEDLAVRRPLAAGLALVHGSDRWRGLGGVFLTTTQCAKVRRAQVRMAVKRALLILENPGC